MRTSVAPAAGLALALAVFTALLVGCGQTNSPVGPVASPDTRTESNLYATTAVGRVDLDALWPNEDGRRWDYQLVMTGRDPIEPTLYPTPADVPPAPPLAVLLPLLGGKGKERGEEPPLPPEWMRITGPYALQFEGQITTLSGVTTQNLREHLQLGPGAARMPAADWRTRFLARLAQARPDLRARLGMSALGQEPRALFVLPLFVHGYAWQKTASYIGTYGDLDTLLAWKFLGADVTPGASFVFQLVPSLASDVFLTAWVVPRGEQRRLQGYSRELQVVYEVDYGVTTAMSPEGGSLGYMRLIDYGSVIYVPGVGPVEALERFYAPSDAPEAITSANRLTLESVTPGPAPMAAGLLR